MNKWVKVLDKTARLALLKLDVLERLKYSDTLQSMRSYKAAFIDGCSNI